jgi:ATP-dependent RNA helicase DDX27
VTLVGEQDRKLLKMAIKSANSSQVKNRVVPADTIQRYKEKVESLSTQIQEVLQEEKEDRSLRQAEMELRKSENLLNHGKEIYARPARTWFQTETEKKNAREETTPKEYQSTRKSENAKTTEPVSAIDGNIINI